MAMRVCVHCKREVTYERENRNLLRGGAVGFWQDVMSGQSTCPDAPLNSQGQQLHDVGDVHTPPTDPEDIEKFLDNTYVPPPPSVPCGQMYGLGEDGEFLSCGLDKGHDGDCAPATPEVAAKMQAAAEAANSADTGSGVMFMDVEHDGDTTTLSATADGVAVSVSYDKSKIGPNDVMHLLASFFKETQTQIVSDLTGLDPATIEAGIQAAAEAAAPEQPAKPKTPDLDDLDDIERFLHGGEDE
jgi:hypothetical protein